MLSCDGAFDGLFIDFLPVTCFVCDLGIRLHNTHWVHEIFDNICRLSVALFTSTSNPRSLEYPF